ncbi:hydroxymethylglutaryl-CoA lyase [Arthrobacter sp. KBS0703]|uniref:hydroxymethylglutaryl-CoA lyase n=1 Tax=Arthrobacter sp. KBS0703 TaxID=1955698 RepID=UPI0009900F68|nr:hydroxymethylglutaryl-CoA lyase [Arthrobacter sp. KBS0703]TSE15027.1 hydroxymethylglutaryl-CoA lyase [Arthrobacter sp. KBS0703]
MTGPRPAVYRDQDFPQDVVVYEVGPRDGLQAEATLVPTDVKVRFIKELVGAGLPLVEATSFVSPKWVPQLADAQEVLAELGDLIRHPVLVPNMRGLERARESGVKSIAVFASATETFAHRNLNAGRTAVCEMAAEVAAEALRSGMTVRGYVSMCFGDPWEGAVETKAVADVSRQLLDAGCYEISLGDTIGVATAAHVTALVNEHVAAGVPLNRLALHFHDTYGQGLSNVLAGLRAGITCFDASTGGIGGCPFAGSATGNLAMEELLWLLHGLGISTGVDLDAVVRAGQTITDFLGRPRSRIAMAMGH